MRDRQGDGDDPARRRARADNAWVVGAVASVGLALALVATTGAGAATITPESSGAQAGSGSAQTLGTVSGVDSAAQSFTVKTSTGSTVKVQVSKATAYRDSLVRSPGFSDVKVGVSVAVIGSTAKGVETAAIVIIGGSGSGAPGGGPSGFGGPGGFARGGTFGTVTAVEAKADSFTVKTSAFGPTSSKSVTVKVTKSTTFRDGGRPGGSSGSSGKASFSDVKVGEQVAVVGTTSKGVETARSVVIGFGGGPGGFARGGTFGTVTAVDAKADSFTVKTRAFGPTSSKSVTVKVTKSTTFRDGGRPGGSSGSSGKASFSDVKVGEQVAVVGTTSKGVETARSVVIGLGTPPASSK